MRRSTIPLLLLVAACGGTEQAEIRDIAPERVPVTAAAAAQAEDPPAPPRAPREPASGMGGVEDPPPEPAPPADAPRLAELEHALTLSSGSEREVQREIARRLRPLFEQCGASALAQGLEARGRVRLHVAVEDGRVVDAEVEAADDKALDVGRCARTRVRAWRFSPGVDGELDVSAELAP